MKYVLTPIEERFWPKVNLFTESGCWEWMASMQNGGYGQISRGHLGEGHVRAHRFSYEYLVGPIPDGLVLDHLCCNPACVNPSHLEPVTQKENQARSKSTFSGLNAVKSHCPRGHPYAGDNLYEARGQRQCRACRRIVREKSRMKAAQAIDHASELFAQEPV